MRDRLSELIAGLKRGLLFAMRKMRTNLTRVLWSTWVAALTVAGAAEPAGLQSKCPTIQIHTGKTVLWDYAIKVTFPSPPKDPKAGWTPKTPSGLAWCSSV